MEIKFKAKREDNHEWVFGNYSKHIHYDKLSPTKEILLVAHNIGYVEDDKLFDRIFQSVVVRPETVCQFTGLVDVNKVEVYANDILEDENGRKFRVYPSKGGFVIKAFYWREDMQDLKWDDSLITMSLAEAQLIGYIEDNCNVVGNFYDQNKN